MPGHEGNSQRWCFRDGIHANSANHSFNKSEVDLAEDAEITIYVNTLSSESF